jgi:hypothetical protein
MPFKPTPSKDFSRWRDSRRSRKLVEVSLVKILLPGDLIALLQRKLFISPAIIAYLMDG